MLDDTRQPDANDADSTPASGCQCVQRPSQRLIPLRRAPAPDEPVYDDGPDAA
ncbi:MAG: hypothetical protein ABI629_06695 [bacterium]